MRAMFSVWGAGRSRAWLPAVLLAGALLAAAASSAPAATAYFTVGIPGPLRDQYGSYILPLTDPAAIAQARQLAAIGGGTQIVFAIVEQGADGTNRNYYQPGQPLWHWHVVEFQGFGPTGIELCDGTPEQVEAAMLSAPAGTQQGICFWAYRILQEIAPVPLDVPTWGTVKAQYRW